jgi:hypothetical protein
LPEPLREPLTVLVVSAMLPTDQDLVRGVVVRREIDQLRDLGVRVLEVGKEPGWCGYGLQALRVIRTRWREDVDVVHAHYGTSGFVATLCAPRTPTVVTMHGSDIAHGWRPGISRYWLQLVLSVVGGYLADRVLVQDETMLGSLPRRLRRRTAVLGQAVRADPLPEEPGSGRAGVLFLSDRTRPVKRFWLAQAAVASAGQGLELRSLDELAPSDVLAAMSRARVGLLTSEREGMPVAVKEALLCGLPVVATDLPPLRGVAAALPYAVTLAGHGAEPLAAALRDTMARPALTASQRAEVTRYLAGRGWVEPEHCRRLIALYQELARHRSAARRRWRPRA